MMPKSAACTTLISPPLLHPSNVTQGPSRPLPDAGGGGAAPPTACPLAAVNASLAGFSLGSHPRTAPWPRLRLRVAGGWAPRAGWGEEEEGGEKPRPLPRRHLPLPSVGTGGSCKHG